MKKMAKSLCCIVCVFALSSCDPSSNKGKAVSLNYIYVDYVASISIEFDADFKVKNLFAHNEDAT